jgi:fructokinase
LSSENLKKSMREVYTIGDTVLDIIFKNGKPVEARPGGGMLNTSISLSRLNIPVHLIADIADDAVGKIIEDFLIKNNISTEYLSRYTEDMAKSRIALAFLDDDNNANYSFYKIRKTGKAFLNIPDIKENDILLFGSFFGIKAEIRDDVIKIIDLAKKKKAIVIYDPNFRKAHLGMKSNVLEYLSQNIELSDIVKGSDEDFENIYNLNSAQDVFVELKNSKCKNIIYTANKYGVWINTPNVKQYYSARNINPLSTIGAGDTFNAGIIYSLLKHNILLDDIQNIKDDIWNQIINTAIDFSSSVCMSYDNYLDENFIKNYKPFKLY